MNATGWVLLLLLNVGLGIGGFTWYRAEGAAPGLVAPESLIVGRAGASVALEATDARAGLRALEAVVVHAGGELTLLDESYPGNLFSGGLRFRESAEIPLVAKQLSDVKGPATLRVRVRDWAWRDGFSGNLTEQEIPLTVDLEAPRVAVHSGLTYVKQGGSGAVAYRVSEPTARDGVRVGSVEYQGFPRPGGRKGERVALFAIPADGDANAPVVVFAQDAAGNDATAGWPLRVQARPQPEAQVRLSKSFLTNVVPRLANGGEGNAAAFHDVNTRIRAENEAKIRELIADSQDTPLFDGALRQMSGSKVTSRFGERRGYVVDGEEISRAVHYGYDLASFAAAPITAAAAGKVLFSDDLGIYGNCVIIDHGLGLVTLYGHLSRRGGQARAAHDHPAPQPHTPPPP
ncbi:MAG: M23 family metallopeptidase, partial [Myxococcota bacterium]